MKCINKTKNLTVVERVEIADSFSARLKGLLGRSGLAKGDALLLDPCNSIHTMFMRFTMDAVFINKEGLVVHIIRRMKPWRMSKIVFGAARTLELGEGESEGKFDLGDQLIFE